MEHLYSKRMREGYSHSDIIHKGARLLNLHRDGLKQLFVTTLGVTVNGF